MVRQPVTCEMKLVGSGDQEAHAACFDSSALFGLEAHLVRGLGCMGRRNRIEPHFTLGVFSICMLLSASSSIFRFQRIRMSNARIVSM